jgi:HK97 family phage portal protein
VSLLSSIRRAIIPELKAWDEANPYLAKLLSWGMTAKTGQAVSLGSALRVATVLACARVMSEDVASMPFRVVRQNNDGFLEDATDHPLYRLLETGPNEWQTGFEFRETLMMHTMLAGNAYAYKNIVRGQILELLPFEPGQVTTQRDVDNVLSYRVTAGGEVQRFSAEQIWHVRGPSINTYLGLDIVQQAREAIGLAMATEESHSRLHQNGISTSGAYSVDGTLDEDSHKRLTAWLAKHYGGLKNSGKPLVLDRGAKWISNTMSGVDAEHIATRNHQIEEICRAMRVIPIMVGYSDKTATYASAEQMFIAHNNIVGKWCRRIDNSADKHLLSTDEYRAGYKVRHQINALLYADVKAKGAWYTAMYMIGAISPNEIRSFEHMRPYAEGDQFRVPVNMVDPAQEPDQQAQDVTDAVQKMIPDASVDWIEFRQKLTTAIKQRNNGQQLSAGRQLDGTQAG